MDSADYGDAITSKIILTTVDWLIHEEMPSFD